MKCYICASIKETIGEGCPEIEAVSQADNNNNNNNNNNKKNNNDNNNKFLCLILKLSQMQYDYRCSMMRGSYYRSQI